MRLRSCPTGGNQWNIDQTVDLLQSLDSKALLGPIMIHRRKQNLSGTAVFAFYHPVVQIQIRLFRPTSRMNVPFIPYFSGIHRDYDALGTKSPRGLID